MGNGDFFKNRFIRLFRKLPRQKFQSSKTIWQNVKLIPNHFRMILWDETRFLIRKKLGKKIAAQQVFSSRSNSMHQNYRLWNNIDWTNGGEEWTKDAVFHDRSPDVWKKALMQDVIEKNIRNESSIMEIGPGSGRWTCELVLYASKLYLVDISEVCLEICKSKFSTLPIETIDAKKPEEFQKVPPSSIDFIWSYDVFVHLNPVDIAFYIKWISQVLKPDGTAILHHAGILPDFKSRLFALRSCMDGEIFRNLIEENGMEVISQSDAHVHMKGDAITVFRQKRRMIH